MPEQYRDTVDLAERTPLADPDLAGPDHAADGDIVIVRANDQFAQDVAAIERATAALRRAEPSLEMWSETAGEARTDDAATLTIRRTRPVWLLIGLLWLSTALVTVGAVAAIARLVG